MTVDIKANTETSPQERAPVLSELGTTAVGQV